jgi:YD repeat-containing protein
MDDGGSQPLMLRDPKYTLKPATGTYPIVTLSDMQISCLSTTSNGEAGEAFLAIGPDGTKYWFDHLVGTKYGRVNKQNPAQPASLSAAAFAAADGETQTTEDPSPPDAEPMFSSGGTQPLIQDRMSAAMFVSKIQDRFGNTLVYHYDPANPLKLLSIVASDGRKVSFAWNGLRITSATAQPDTPADARTWTYGYGTDGRLSSVTLPDASRWTFNLGLTGEGSLPDMFASSCTKRYNANASATDAVVSTVTAPSGLTGTFTMRHRWHARSYANTACINQLYESIPPLYENLSLVQRTLSGPGLQAQAWTYAYSPATASSKHDSCAATQTCTDRSWVDVTEPDGTRTRYTHSTRDGVMEGKLLTTEIFEVGGALLRTETNTYPSLASLPFQARLGEVFGRMRSNMQKMETRYPMTQRVITQQGRRFYWYVHSSCGASSNALCLDAFGRPTKTVKLSQPVP